MSTSIRSEVSDALHDLGAAAKHAASDVKEQVGVAVAVAAEKAKDASGTAVEKAKDASSTAVDKAKDAGSTAVGKAKDAATDQADRARSLAADTSADARTRGRKGRKAARKARSNALSSASALLEDATSRGKGVIGHGRDVVTRRPPKKRGRTLLKIVAGIAVVGAVAAAVRSLRPKQVPSTGSSIPPKVRPVPTPSDDAVGGLPTAGEDAPVTEG